MSTLTSETAIEAPERNPDTAEPVETIPAAFQQLDLTGEPAWLRERRQAGLARFQQLGFPTLKDEDWRFTNVAPVAEMPFRPVREPGDSPRVDWNALPFAGLEAARLVLVDGHLDRELSRLPADLEGATLTGLAEALQDPGTASILESHLGRLAGQEENPFGSLNTAFFTDGLLLHVPPGLALSFPVHLVHFATATGASIQPRLLVVAGADSRVTLLESHFSLTDKVYLNNSVTEMFLGENAAVEHCKLQDENLAAFHFGAHHTDLARSSRFRFHSIDLGASISRNNIRTTLSGEGLECILNGLYVTRDRQVADHHMIVNHAKPHCESHEYFNGILADRSRGVFHGRILVQQEAQKTDAKQTNKNLLLSDNATANTKPQLEIYADDVKCTHGATLGQLDPQSIFYLRSRGIGPDLARRMLIHSFAGEITERILCRPIRDELDRLVWDRLEEHEDVSLDHRPS